MSKNKKMTVCALGLMFVIIMGLCFTLKPKQSIQIDTEIAESLEENKESSGDVANIPEEAAPVDPKVQQATDYVAENYGFPKDAKNLVVSVKNESSEKETIMVSYDIDTRSYERDFVVALKEDGEIGELISVDDRIISKNDYSDIEDPDMRLWFELQENIGLEPGEASVYSIIE